MNAGMEVVDVGVCTTPVAYYAQFALDCPAVAMVTASHNENGWTGVKMGAQKPLTFGPDEMNALKDIVLGNKGVAKAGGKYTFVEDFREAYLDAVTKGHKLSRPIKVVVATGNGTRCLWSGSLAPHRRRGDRSRYRTRLHLPKYNPIPKTSRCCTSWPMRCGPWR